MNFTEWMDKFVKTLIQSGMSVPQAYRYWREFQIDAIKYYKEGLPPEEAATIELIPF